MIFFAGELISTLHSEHFKKQEYLKQSEPLYTTGPATLIQLVIPRQGTESQVEAGGVRRTCYTV